MSWVDNKKTIFSSKYTTWKSGFFKQMLVLLKSGINVDVSLKLLRDGEGRNSKYFNILSSLYYHVYSGESMSYAMATSCGVFSSIEINIMRSAEEIGKIYIAFEELSSFGEKFQKMYKKIISASIYPSIVLCVSFFVLMLLSIFVVPKFEVFFAQGSTNVQLPAITQYVMAACKFLSENCIFIVFLILLLLGCFYLTRGNDKIAMLIDRCVFRIPIVRGIIINYNLSLFFKIAGVLLKFGVPIQNSLAFAKNVLSNRVIANEFSEKLRRIEVGDSLSDIFKQNKFLNPCEVGLILAGEQSGSLSDVFVQISQSAESKIDNTIISITTVVEPFFITLLAVVVGVIISAFFLPMINIMSSFD